MICTGHVVQEKRKIHSKEFHNFSSTNILRVVTQMSEQQMHTFGWKPTGEETTLEAWAKIWVAALQQCRGYVMNM
jgi:hypothetical protein